MPVFSTSQVTLQLTGTSSVPNNFTIDIYGWDVTTDAAIFSRTYATGVTRTTVSAVNGGSLTASPYYEVTGITGSDNYIKLTSTTTCTSTTTQDITSAALSVYVPVNGSIYSAPGAYDNFGVQSPGTNLSPGSHPISQFDSLSYLSASDFTVTYLSGTYQSGGATVTGAYANGPFSSISITKNGKSFTINGSVNTGLNALNSLIHGIIQLTYTPSGKSTNFDYYYNPSPQ
jgi:hypothetical protein